MTVELDNARDLAGAYGDVSKQLALLENSAKAFSVTMTTAFSRSIVSGKSFEDTLKNVGQRLSNLTLDLALKPVASALVGNLNGLFGNLFDGSSLKAATGAIKPFAAGGVIGTPTYFPMNGGGLGLAGEAGPEAIMPLARGPDGRLGVASGGGALSNVTVHIATPDVESFRRSETYLTGQIARAVARGQRGL
jgi:phage-related minor tail protein